MSTHWWCEACGRKIDGREVTFQETHDERVTGGCGQPVHIRLYSTPTSVEDVVERLRALAGDYGQNWKGRGTPDLLDEAAAEISTLRARIVALEAELKRPKSRNPGVWR